MSSTLKATERETSKLRPEDQLELVEHLIHRLKASKTKAEKTRVDPLELYGTCKGLWEMDAQEYVNKMREGRFWHSRTSYPKFQQYLLIRLRLFIFSKDILNTAQSQKPLLKIFDLAR